MDFNDIIGQRIVVDSLKKAILEEKVANGYIFTGPKGSGKKLIAYTFANALNCKADNSIRPCGKCSSCMKFASNNHPNVEVIRPTGTSIKIKQIRQVISDVSRKPFESGYKIVIIDDAGKMTVDAQDAFLKTLEEPPENTIFVLLVENHHSLLPTVLSRCQVFQLKPIPLNEVKAYIIKGFSNPDSQIKLATVYSNGIIGRAMQILRDDKFFNVRDRYFYALSLFFEEDFIKLSQTVNDFTAIRNEAEEFVDFLLGFFRDIAVYSELEQQCGEDGTEGLIINIDKLSDIVRYRNILTEQQLDYIIENIKRTKKYLGHNVSIRNSIDAMLLNILEVINGKNNRGKV